jgi:hypothetical protein
MISKLSSLPNRRASSLIKASTKVLFLVLLFVENRSQAQGLVNFLNGSTSLIQINLGTPQSLNVVNAPSSVYGTRVQLYYQLGTVPQPAPMRAGLIGDWLPVGNLGTAIASNGRFSVGSVTISNVCCSSNVWLQFAAWTGANLTASQTFPTVSAALQDGTAKVAFSGVWSNATGDPNFTPPYHGNPIPATPTALNAIGNIIMDFLSPPYISVQPTPTIGVLGASATFQVQAFFPGENYSGGGGLVSFQWRFNGTNIFNDITHSQDLTYSTFTLTNLTFAAAGVYDVVASDELGAVVSQPATLTVISPLTITAQPAGITNAVGSTNSLSVSASGNFPLRYQWYKSLGNILGATNPLLSLTGSQTNDTDNYYVVVSDSYSTATSSIASVVIYAPGTITSQPSNQIVGFGSVARFISQASAFPLPTFQWQHNGTNLPGATYNSFQISNVQLSDIGTYQLLTDNGFSSTQSLPVTLNIFPTILSSFAGASTIWGKPAELSSVVVGSGPLTYQWYQNGLPITGATNTKLNFSSIQFTNAGFYTVVVSNPYGSVTNIAAQVVVNPAELSLGFCPALTIRGVAGYSYVIQSSTNLSDTNNWVTLTNLTLAQPIQLWVDTNVDASSPFYSKTFYRVLPGQ